MTPPETKLLPCPWCKAKPNWNDDFKVYDIIHSDICPLQFHIEFIRPSQVNQWNTRQPSPELERVSLPCWLKKQQEYLHIQTTNELRTSELEKLKEYIGLCHEHEHDLRKELEKLQADCVAAKDLLLLIHNTENCPLCSCGEMGENFDNCHYTHALSTTSGQQLLEELAEARKDREWLDFAILYPNKFLKLMETRAHGGFPEQEKKQGRHAIDEAIKSQ